MSFQIPVRSRNFAALYGRGTVLLALLLSFSALSVAATQVNVELSGAQEVPAVDTQAHGQGTLEIGDDGKVSGTFTTRGLTGTMAHIHQAPAGENGDVVIPLQRTDDGSWALPDDAQLSTEQLKHLNAGKMYVNVHTEAHPGGEIRGQIKP